MEKVLSTVLTLKSDVERSGVSVELFVHPLAIQGTIRRIESKRTDAATLVAGASLNESRFDLEIEEDHSPKELPSVIRGGNIIPHLTHQFTTRGFRENHLSEKFSVSKQTGEPKRVQCFSGGGIGRRITRCTPKDSEDDGEEPDSHMRVLIERI